MSSMLPTLATEIIENICRHLEPLDLYSLRLVSKDLHKKSFHTFCRTCFTTIQTDLSTPGLLKLQAISKHETLRFHIETLLLNSPGWADEVLTTYRHPESYIVAPLPGVDMLSSILTSRLVNCRSFCLELGGEWETTVQPDVLTDSDRVAIILATIAEMGVPIKSFVLEFGMFGRGQLDGRKLDLGTYQKPGFRRAWEGLQELSLSYTMMHFAVPWNLELLLQARSLRKLKLHLGKYESQTLIAQLSNVEHLSNLEELSLNFRFTTEQDLSRLLRHYRDSLRSLELESVTFPEGNGTWVSMFTEMKRNLSCLENIRVSSLAEVRLRATFDRIKFPALRDNKMLPEVDGRIAELAWVLVDDTLGVQYQGSHMDLALEIMAASVRYMSDLAENSPEIQEVVES